MAGGRAPRGAGASRIARVVPAAKRAWPVVLMAWDRWQSLSPQEKERYKRQAKQAAERARVTLENAAAARRKR